MAALLTKAHWVLTAYAVLAGALMFRDGFDWWDALRCVVIAGAVHTSATAYRANTNRPHWHPGWAAALMWLHISGRQPTLWDGVSIVVIIGAAIAAEVGHRRLISARRDNRTVTA